MIVKLADHDVTDASSLRILTAGLDAGAQVATRFTAKARRKPRRSRSPNSRSRRNYSFRWELVCASAG